MVAELIHENAYLKRLLFGRRGDRLQEDPNPGLLFGTPEATADQEEEDVPEEDEAAFLNIDNNHSERQIKQMVIGRKNWIFCGSENGAHHAAILFSLVGSCKLHGVDPFAYFRDVLMRIHTHPTARVHELVPREWQQRFGGAVPLLIHPAA